ncbi:MAG: hypothetical protein JST68_27050 [Bacteroidetes bacterium]|nr:hypothetical protein [Bacteroidota bacterium]
MSLHQSNALIDHLDSHFNADAPSRFTPEQKEEMQRLIAEDEDVAREWNYLQLAVEAVHDAGLNKQVKAVRKEWEAQSATAPEQDTTTAPDTQEGGIVRNLYRNVMRVAACALLVAGGAAIFKYVRLSSSSLYSDYYNSYDLNTSRGAANQEAIEQAYSTKNWNQVLALFTTGSDRNNKTDFLAGMADLELKKFDDAIAHFEQIIATNSQSHDDYFGDEAEYYLAISWLGKNKINEAMPTLEKIRKNKNHKYYEQVNKMSFTDLRLTQYKENK